MHEVLLRQPPSLLIDTHGQPFGYYLSSLSGIPTIAYIHYPLISSDMIQKVRERRPSYNNSARISSTESVSFLKLIYYKLLLTWYSTCGLFCKLALCNSTWTFNHIRSMWSCTLIKVYPPCDVTKFLSIPLDCPKSSKIISIGQFRPEKDHELQIHSLSILLKKHESLKNAKLLLVGSCRDLEDHQRVEDLRNLVKKLKIEQNVEFFVNVSYSELLDLMKESKIGLHTMWNEHFGICVVELMASGLLTVAHNSAGPKEDIITQGVDGFLASTDEEYAEFIAKGLLEFKDLKPYRENARKKVLKFDQKNFEEQFKLGLKQFL